MPESRARKTTTRKPAAKSPARKTTAASARRAPAKSPHRAGVKNFGFPTNAAPVDRGEDIPFYLSNGDPTEYYVRGDADDEGLAVIAAEIQRAEQTQDEGAITAGLLDTLDNLFTPETGRALLQAIKAKTLRLAQLQDIIEWAAEQIGERPTTPSRT